MSVHGPTKSGKYEVRWREGTRNRSRTFDLKGDAAAFDAKVRRSSQLGEPVPQRTESETLDEVFANFLANKHNLAPRTKALYKQIYLAHVHPFLGYVPVKQLDEDRMEGWQADRIAAGAGPEVIGKCHTLLSQVFKRAVRRQKMVRNPMDGLEKPATESTYKPPIPPEKIEALRLYFLKQEREGDAVLIQLWGYCGLRVGEGLALAPDDIVRAEGLWISHSLEDDGSLKGTKTGKEGFVPVPEPVSEDLMPWKRSRGAEALLFGRAKDGKGWTKTDRNNWVRRYFRPACIAVGLPANTTPRDLRITAASLMIVEGKRPTEIAEILRHSLATSIDVYQRWMKEQEGQPNRPMAEIIREARTHAEQEDAKERLIAANAGSKMDEESA